MKNPNNLYQMYGSDSFEKLDKRLTHGLRHGLLAGIKMEQVSQVERKDDAEQVVVERESQLIKDKTELSDELKRTMQEGQEMAIIAYWKPDSRQEFKCFHYFYVPNPWKRDTKRSERTGPGNKKYTTNISTVLYPSQNNEVFFFFSDTRGPRGDKLDTNMGLLNLDVDLSKANRQGDILSHRHPTNTVKIFPIEPKESGKEKKFKKILETFEKPVSSSFH